MRMNKKLMWQIFPWIAMLLIINTDLFPFNRWHLRDYRKMSLKSFALSSSANNEIDPDTIDGKLIGAAIFYATNEERKKKGLPLLKFSLPLFETARMHTKDMLENRFMGHISPLAGKRNIEDRIKIFHPAGAVYCDENVAYLQTFRITYLKLGRWFVHYWMLTPKSRDKILNEKFIYMGVAAQYNSSSGSFMATQVFSGKLQ